MNKRKRNFFSEPAGLGYIESIREITKSRNRSSLSLRREYFKKGLYKRSSISKDSND